MPDLAHTLQTHDLGYLKMVAGLWGIELNAPDARKALLMLENEMLDAELLTEVIETLPDGAKIALQEMLRSEGMLLWSQFCRKFGEVRVMGASRRDRERPDLKPANSAEVLWYRALIGKAFLSITSEEPQEYAYIPEDFLEFVVELLPPPQEALLGRPASPAEYERPVPANDHILDHTCTLLAATRVGLTESQLAELNTQIPLTGLRGLLQACGCLDMDAQINPTRARQFLEASRGMALEMLTQAWLVSNTFNELLLLPHLAFEGDWKNNPLSARQFILETISKLPAGKWWNISAFISAIKEQSPDFQRPAGDYDSWFIRDLASGEYLRGFTTWDEVDGELIHFLICGPMHWLGLVDLAVSANNSEPTAFKLSSWAADLLIGQPPSGLMEEKGQIRMNSEGILEVPNLVPRSIRYQIARFCEWLPEKGSTYRYRLAASTLAAAKKQNLFPRHLVALLKQHSAGPIPPGVLQALDRWDHHGIQAHQQSTILLRVESPEVLDALKKSHSARYIVEVITPTIALIKAGSAEKIRAALLELGYLCDVEIQI